MSFSEGLGLGSGEAGVGRRKKVKLEGSASLSWVDPLYAEQPSLCWNRSDPIARAAFEKAYDFSNTGIPPKRLKFGVHLDESEVDTLFGQRVGSNGYGYLYSEDIEFVKRVEWLWMVTHQRTQVPNTRLINLAEAKGLAYEKKKGKKAVNWCVHAEWTCRDKLRRINQDAIKIGDKNVVEVSGDEQDEERTIAVGLDQRVLASSDLGAASAIGLESAVAGQGMAIGEWEEYLSLLERETPTLDAHVSRLCAEKDAARMDLVRISSQVQYGQTLLKNSSSKLVALQKERDKLNEKLASLKGGQPQSEVEIVVAAVELAAAVRKVESQEDFIDQFRDSFASGTLDEEVSAAQSKEADLLFSTAVKKQELWKLHRVALSEQLKGMKTGYQRPSLYPSPLPFFYVDCQTIDVPVVQIEISACPFCTRGFDPAWDCRLSSCSHAYHTWCAYTHFSQEPKCMFEGCNVEPHEDWWVMAGIRKPQGQKVEPRVESWDLCKSVNVGASFQGRTTRSLSTNNDQSTHSNARSPSVGSFQDFSHQLELIPDPKLKFFTQIQKRGQVLVKDDSVDGGGCKSPKRKKICEDNADCEGLEEQVFTPKSVENLKKIFGNTETSVESRGSDPAVGRGSSQRSRLKSTDGGGVKGSRSPKHRRSVVSEDGLNKPSPKRKRGGHKIIPVDEIEVSVREENKMDEFEDGSKEDGLDNDSAKAEGGEEASHHSEMTGEERSPREAKAVEKKGRVGRGGKKPVAERVSLSKVTQASKGATPK